MMEKLIAWSVHLYTALGLLAAAGMAVLIVRGGDESFRWAFVLMFVATIIDSSDGYFARKARVKDMLPQFDGRRLDDLIDFHTYTSLPLLLIWRAGILPDHLAWLLLLPLLASAYGFSQSDAKTDDGFFLGFPSYWNVVAFYLYELQPPVWFAASVIIFFALMTFVPARYLYASTGGPFMWSMIVGGIVWAVLLALILLRVTHYQKTLALVSLAYPGIYLALSWMVTLRRRSE
ncbi:MAG TPA: CDP-alcohol phosphatidyltransferase family protein [Blastocatellia bacterium]|jgi:phosphatidylcholine synthase